MNPDNRRPVAKFLAEAKPITEEGWEESRLVMKWGGNTFLIENNFPEWTTSQILDFAKSQPGIEIETITVRVKAE